MSKLSSTTGTRRALVLTIATLELLTSAVQLASVVRRIRAQRNGAQEGGGRDVQTV